MAIWPGGMKIEVLGVTGPYASGKTLFGLTIDPTRTRYYDFEKSGGNYESTGCDRVDVPRVLHEKFPAGYKAIDIFKWWIQDIRQLPTDKYSVIMVDTIGDAETGLADYVESRFADYGFKSPESFVSTKGIFWKYVRDEWKLILSDMASRCETFVFTSHLRKVWAGDRPTSRQEPVGKSTLMELASLYLRLEREWVDGSKLVTPKIPRGIVIKSRLASFIPGEVIPTLPPCIPEATPDAIRRYIESPPKRIKASEQKPLTDQLTDDDRLQLRAEIAVNEVAAEQARNERLNSSALRRVLAQEQLQASAQGVADQPATCEQPIAVAVQPAVGGSQETPAAVTEDQVGTCDTVVSSGGVERQVVSASSELLGELKQLKGALKIGDETWKKLLDVYSVPSATKLTADDAEQLASRLRQKLAAVNGKSELAKWASTALGN
jgi:hypothetical protein